MPTNNILATIALLVVVQHHGVDDLYNVQRRHFPLPFLLLQPLNIQWQQHKERKEKEGKEGKKWKKENRNESEMGPLLVGGPSSLLTSYKFFFLFLHKQNTSFHTLGAHAPPGFKSPRSVINTNENEKQYPATWCAIKSSNAKHKLNEKQYAATWCPNKSSGGKHKLQNPMLTKLNLIMTQHKTKYHFWWFKKMNSIAMHRNPGPNTMLIANVHKHTTIVEKKKSKI